jgi:hypothetical protein
VKRCDHGYTTPVCPNVDCPGRDQSIIDWAEAVDRMGHVAAWSVNASSEECLLYVLGELDLEVDP